MLLPTNSNELCYPSGTNYLTNRYVSHFSQDRLECQHTRVNERIQPRDIIMVQNLYKKKKKKKNATGRGCRIFPQPRTGVATRP